MDNRVEFPNVEVVFVEDLTQRMNISAMMQLHYNAFMVNLSDLDDAIELYSEQAKWDHPVMLVALGIPSARRFRRLSARACCSMCVQIVDSFTPPLEEDLSEQRKLRRIYIEKSSPLHLDLHAFRLALDNPHLEILEVR